MIRELEISELRLAGEIGREFWEEGCLPGTIKPEVFEKNWTFFINNGMGKIFGLYENGELVGAIGGFVIPDLNDGEKTATEAFWFVRDAYRGGGIKLLLYFLKYAKEIGCVRVNMVHLFNEHANKLSKLYVKLGFKPVEAHYVLSL
jgi:GNAT superfamily N-acetyltransferase